MIASVIKLRRPHMPQNFLRFLFHGALVIALAACGSTSVKPTFYRVKQGDTLERIAKRYHQKPQNILRWNKLSGPRAIQAGQVLRVTPAWRAAAPIRARVLPAAKYAQTGSQLKKSPSSPASAAPAATPALALQWPTHGPVLSGFDGNANKGVNIGGKLGTPIQAATDGTVVYSGNGLRGYGNLLIIKHQDDFLTVYAHNRTLLAKEGQKVKKGQQVAEMGNTDANGNRVMLHFEVRYKGHSVDPMRYLPGR